MKREEKHQVGGIEGLPPRLTGNAVIEQMKVIGEHGLIEYDQDRVKNVPVGLYLYFTWPEGITVGVQVEHPIIPSVRFVAAYEIGRKILEHNARMAQQHRGATA